MFYLIISTVFWTTLNHFKNQQVTDLRIYMYLFFIFQIFYNSNNDVSLTRVGRRQDESFGDEVSSFQHSDASSRTVFQLYLTSGWQIYAEV